MSPKGRTKCDCATQRRNFYISNFLDLCSQCTLHTHLLWNINFTENTIKLPKKDYTTMWYDNPENFHRCLSISDLAVFNYFICGNRIHISYVVLCLLQCHLIGDSSPEGNRSRFLKIYKVGFYKLLKVGRNIFF